MMSYVLYQELHPNSLIGMMRASPKWIEVMLTWKYFKADRNLLNTKNALRSLLINLPNKAKNQITNSQFLNYENKNVVNGLLYFPFDGKLHGPRENL